VTAPDLTAWLGRTQKASTVIDPWPAAALTAALGRDDPPAAGDPIPPFWHQLYAKPVVAAAKTGLDGHERLGEFLPAVADARRMWAGGRLTIHEPLRIGDRLTRTSTIRSITPKRGRQGPLIFVTVEHRYDTERGLALVEEQDIVYRQGGALAGELRHRQQLGRWQRSWTPDPVLLFRYSALTYNGHRIHYDADYARTVEDYPGLVVHGPLLATLMLDLVRRHRPEHRVTAFAFRAVSPLFAGQELTVHGAPEEDRVLLWVTGPDLVLAMEGQATIG
jgi:3-methylfumaryl-CoA hydratase